MNTDKTNNFTMQHRNCRITDLSFEEKLNGEFYLNAVKPDLNDKTIFSLETDSCIGETKLEGSNYDQYETALNNKRSRNIRADSKGKPRLSLKKDSNKRSSKRKRNKPFKIGALDNDQSSRRLSDVNRKSDISLNSTLNHIQKDLKDAKENKFTLLEFKENKASINEMTNKINSNDIIIKTIKLSLERLKAGKVGLKENLNLFDILKTDINKVNNNTIELIDIDQTLEDRTKRKVSEFITPNKVNFYEEHSKRFYTEEVHSNMHLVEKKEELLNLNKDICMVSESPFKLVSIPDSLMNSNDCIYLYSHMSKALLIIGFFGIIILFLQDKNINNCVGETLEYLLKFWKSNCLIIASIIIMTYYFHSKIDDNNIYKDNLAKMIFENMKIVLESERSNETFISITQQDIITYFTYQIKVTEEFLAYNVIPLISKFAQNDATLIEEKQHKDDSFILSWRLNTNK